MIHVGIDLHHRNLYIRAITDHAEVIAGQRIYLSEIDKLWQYLSQFGDEKKSFSLIIECIRKIYGPEFADEVKSAARSATDSIHELLHKVADPEFHLLAPEGLDLQGSTLKAIRSQTKKTYVETCVDEMITQQIEKGYFEDSDNAFAVLEGHYSTVREFLNDLKKEQSHPELTKILKDASLTLERKHPDLVNLSSEDEVPNPYYEGTYLPATSVAMFLVQDYIEKKLPHLVDILIKEQSEILLKKFLNLVNLTFQKAQ